MSLLKTSPRWGEVSWWWPLGHFVLPPERAGVTACVPGQPLFLPFQSLMPSFKSRYPASSIRSMSTSAERRHFCGEVPGLPTWEAFGYHTLVKEPTVLSFIQYFSLNVFPVSPFQGQGGVRLS